MHLRPVLPLLLAGLVTSACGGASSTETAGPAGLAPAQIVQAANERTVAEGSSRVALEIATRAQGLDVDVTGEGLVDYEAGTAEFTVSLPGTVDSLTLRLLSDALFVTGFPGAEPDQWVRLDTSELGAGGGLGELGSFADPTSSFDQLQAVADDVARVGSEEVRGTPTTHYRGSVLLADVLEQAPADDRDALQQQFQPLRDAGLERLPFDAFIDDEGRLRRMVQTLSLDPGAFTGAAPAEPGAPGEQPQASQVEVMTTVEVFDFGVEVDVQEPPAEQVTDGLEGLLGGGGATAPS